MSDLSGFAFFEEPTEFAARSESRGIEDLMPGDVADHWDGERHEDGSPRWWPEWLHGCA